MRQASDELHRLIKSLSKTEKKYFKSYASRHVLGDKNTYLKLYEAIEKQDNYDEQAIKELFKSDKLASYLPTAKSYLLSLLLDSLYTFELNTNPELKLRKKLQHAVILFEKGFLDESLKMLNKLKLKAQEDERISILLDAFRLEKSIIARKYYKGYEVGDLQQLHDEEHKLLELIENQNEYWLLHGMVYTYHFSKGSARSESELLHLQDVMSDPLMASADKALSFRAKMDYLHTQAIYHFAQGKAEEAYGFNRQFLELMEANTAMMEEYPRRYMATLNNYLIDSLNLRRYSELEEGLKKLRALPDSDAFKKIENLEVDVFRLSSILDLNAAIATGSFSKGYELKEGLEQGLKNYDKLIVQHNKITLYYLMAYVSFGVEKFSESLKWTNQIINADIGDILQDIQAAVRILNLLVHFELGNYDILDYSIRSVERYLRTRGHLHDAERLILNFLRNIGAAVDSKETFKLFQKLKNDIEKMTEQKEKVKLFSYFDFFAWAESKLKKVPLGEATKSEGA